MARLGKATGTFQLATNEKFVLCPYSPSHQLTNLRLGNHIAKCRSNYVYNMGVQGRQVHYGECRYNPAHRLPDPELRWHERRCSSQFDIVPTYSQSQFPPTPVEEAPLVLRSMREELEAEELRKLHLNLGKSSTEPDLHGPEDWEYDSCFNKHQTSYDPAEKLAQDNVCYPRHLLTRTERRHFKAANSLRRSLLEANLPPPPKLDQELEPFDVLSSELDPQ